MAARIARHFVFVGDVPRAEAFWVGVLGLVVTRTADEGFVHLDDPAGGAGIALHHLDALSPPRVPPQRRSETATKLVLEVTDLPATRAAILAHGGLADDPWEWAGTTFCECTDPEGNPVQLRAI